jgi:hypothetical protein
VWQKISTYVRQHNWFAVGVEVLVVIVGLMLAFQLDRWREGIAERRQEQFYINRLIADVETDIPAIEYAVALQSLRLEFVELLMLVSKDTAAATEKPIIFLGSVNQAAFTYTPVLTSHTFENLRATGDLRLIRDESVKSIMFNYYGFDESQRQFRPLQIDTEFRHFELAAGVLDHDQEIFIQDHWSLISPENIDAVKASELRPSNLLSAAERLQARPELIAWLPYLRDMQLEQIRVHIGRLDRANTAWETLTDYALEIRAAN